MADLDNSNKDLITGVVSLLRNEVSGWSTNSEYNVPNVWTKDAPNSTNDEFPRAIVDVVAGDEEELSIDLDTRLYVATLRVVIFADDGSSLEELKDASDQAIRDFWDNYTGDWTIRESDGESEVSEDTDVEEMLRYNKMLDYNFETIKVSD